jgi:hypothetical protein
MHLNAPGKRVLNQNRNLNPPPKTVKVHVSYYDFFHPPLGTIPTPSFKVIS